MSVQNTKTIEAYQKGAKKYLMCNKILSSKSLDDKTKIHDFIRKTLKNIPLESNVLEIGSADGEMSKFIKELGYSVVASDVTLDFIKSCKEKGLKTIKFNILTDNFKRKYNAIICWRVFVHFTNADSLKALNKSYDALENNGLFILSVIDRNCKNVDNEWIDFPDIFHLGVDRYFNYYSKKEMDEIINKTKFNIIDFKRISTGDGNKLLIYVLRKEVFMFDVDKEIKKYINKNIKTQYISNNYGGHGWNHIKEVIKRSFELMKEFNLKLNPNMVYVIAAYHDIGYSEDPDNHEQVSSEKFLNDNGIKKYFTDSEIKIIAEAIVDHRASLEYEARSDYGKLVSSADRAIDVKNMLKRSIEFQYEKHKEENPTALEVIDYSFKKLSSKYGKGGYAKMYYPDKKYQNYLKKMNKLCSDKDEFVKEELKIISKYSSLQIMLYVNRDLKKYIEESIIPGYSVNEPAHGIDHIKYVIDRSFELVQENKLDVNLDMVYTIAAYHDIGHHIDSKTHEIISGEIMSKDKKLKEFFNEEELTIIKEAIEDHRASSKTNPRSIYGEIVSSADRNDSVEKCLRRSYTYGKKLNPTFSDQELFENAHNVLLNKFGEGGYAKFFFKDKKYEKFLTELRSLLKDKDKYIETQRKYVEKLKKEGKI